MAVLADPAAGALAPRQTATGTLSSSTGTESAPPGFVEEDGRSVPFWFTRTGVIVKWSVCLGLLVILGLYLFFGYQHAQRRLRKGLKPLAYHRWLVGRQELAKVDPRYAYAAQPVGLTNYQPEYYGMQAMPPPVYDPKAPRPPVYEGPDGAAKVAPSQFGNKPTDGPEDDEEYQAPPGPPPAVSADHTGSSNNPYRL